MAWQPQEEPLRQLAGYLQDSLSGYNRSAQQHAEQMLTQAYSSPDITNYLTYLFVSSEPPASLGCPPEKFSTIRASAGINLKNALRTAYRTISPSNQSYIRSSLLVALQDPNSQIRSFAGNVMTEIVRQGGILDWPELIPDLLFLIANENGSTNHQAQEGAMASLEKICEDNRKLLDKEYNGQRPLNVLIPKLLEFTASPLIKVRSSALSTVKVFLPQKPQAIMTAIDDLLSRLFQLAGDKSTEVRRKVCQLFLQIVEIRPDKVEPHMEGLVDYMLVQQSNGEDDDLSLDAAEFWLGVGEHDQLRMRLGPYLDKIIPVLLESMIYSQDDIIRLENAGDDASQEDRPEDIKPQFATNQSARGTANTNTSTTSLQNGTDPAKILEEDDLSEGEIDEDEEDGDDPEEKWNLRKCSAAALDVLATVFHSPVFETTLPYLNENLQHNEWPRREAAVLALGAVADGCMDAVMPHLPSLIPYLINLLNDREPVVRQITCWTLGRYSEWASHLMTEPDRDHYFGPMLEGILNKMLDSNKRVQEAAASAFANLEEKADANLIPYIDLILQQFVRCFQTYKDRNMFILYDCVQTLAEHTGPHLQKPEFINLLMPALIERWNKLTDDSRELFPLLECLGYIAAALCDLFSAFAIPIFGRCIRIIHQNLQQHMSHVNNPALEAPDKDFLVTSLDLLSAIIQAIHPSKSGQLVSESQPKLFELLSFCMEDPSNDVRQSAYALLGDCAINLYDHLKPYLPVIMPLLIGQLDLDSIKDEDIESGFSVLNNACWSCGEIAMVEREQMMPFVDQLYQRLINIMSNPEIPDSVKENVAIALGRLGVGNAERLAPHLDEFAQPFLEFMNKVEYTDEKVTAFMGFNKMVEQNPKAMEKCLIAYFKAIALFPIEPLKRSPEILQSFKEVLRGYRSLIPDFDAFLSQLPTTILDRLQTNYGL
ncbi:MAG: hypothetical protein M1834_000138 [Cirrosporium novae-zelandiae]|nr:MAG: hypothetical protein M1834_000138 [Cirrosporium novae-zelandiae]